ncbi:hypothetical protein ACTFIV_005103 [Dictyostelium citrinum]
MVLCPSCQKPVYFAERQLYQGKEYHQICYNILIKQENSSRPKTFAIHEQIFCNVEENSKYKYPLAPVDGYYSGIQVSPQVSPSPSLPSPSSPSPSPSSSPSPPSPSSPSPSSSSPSQPSTNTQNSVTQPKSKNSVCKKCSSETKPTDKFCTSCGNKL